MSYRTPRRAYIFTFLFVLQHLFFRFDLFYKPFLGIFFPEILNEAWVFMTDRLGQLRPLRWVESIQGNVETGEEREKDAELMVPVSRGEQPKFDE